MALPECHHGGMKMKTQTVFNRLSAGLRKSAVFIFVSVFILGTTLPLARAAGTAGIIALKCINNLTSAVSTPYTGKTVEISVDGQDTELEIVVEASTDVSAVTLELLTESWGRYLLAPMDYDGETGLYRLTVTLPAHVRSGDYYLALMGNPDSELIYFMDYSTPAPLTVKNSEQILDVPQVNFTYEPETPQPDGKLYLYFDAQSPYGIASVDYMAYFPSQEWAVLPVADYNAETGLWESVLAIGDFELESGDYFMITFGATDMLGNSTQRTGEQQTPIQVKLQE